VSTPAPVLRLDQPADDYAAFCTGVQRLCRVDLASYKRGQMERRIRSFAQARGKSSLLDYLALMAHDEGELDQFLDRMTINVSQLWRNPLQWQALAEQVIPVLAVHGRIRAWSAGCSYGAEVFTLAAVCREAAPQATLEVRGSDIDERVLARARCGCFSQADMLSVPEASRRRWFEQTASGWQVSPELVAVARFETEDLLSSNPRRESYDLITCRNTVIYLTDDSSAKLYGKLAAALRPGGFLMVGSAEWITDAEHHRLELVHPFTYRKN
jgi:chemotaxis protein methyltransferase CheR